MAGHARLSPSNPRWYYCPGSVREEAPYPDISSPAAIDGTGSHLLLECCLAYNCDASAYEGQVIGVNHEDHPNGWLVSKERADRVQIALDYVKRRKEELVKEWGDFAQVDVESESKANPGAAIGRDDWYGTADITVICRVEDEIRFVEVVDYKDGTGFVAAEGNTQLMSYLIGKVHELTEQKIGKLTFGCMATIIQPKTNTPIRQDRMLTSDLATRLPEFKRRAAETDEPDAPLVAGKHCKYCKHKANCGQQAQDAIQATTEVMDPMALKVIEAGLADLTAMTNEQLAALADAESVVLDVFKRIKDEMTRRIETGHNISGWTLKPGNSKHVWAFDETRIAEELAKRKVKKKDMYITKLVSPAQVRKIGLTKKQLADIEDELVSTVAGELKLTKVEVRQPVDDFADLIVKPEAISFL